MSNNYTRVAVATNIPSGTSLDYVLLDLTSIASVSGAGLLLSSSTGPQGIQGVAGVAGSAGTTGSQGPQGLSGATGEQGLQGLQGLQGFSGATGPQGDIGLTGSSGVTGPQGNIGLTGPSGATGTPGASGVTGADGAAGAAGSQGTQGIQGIQGIQGLSGATGTPGADGAPGASGVTGLQGPSGATGLAGPWGTILGVLSTQTDLQTALDAKSPSTHTHLYSALVSIPTTFQPVIGSLATQAVAGNDTRLADARTPLAHASSHITGGADVLSVLSLRGYPGGTANFLRSDGAFAAPTAAVSAPFMGAYATSSFTVATDTFGIQARRLTLTSSQRGTIEGTGRMVLHG